MKKVIAVVLTLVLVLMQTSVLALQTFNMTPFEKNDDIFTIDVNSDTEVAFIETTLTVKDLSYTHKYENDYYYSFVQSDILVGDYYSSSRFPVLRTTVSYNAEKPLNIYAVSIIVDGVEYYFEDAKLDNGISDFDHGMKDEEVRIVYGSNSNQFLAELVTLWDGCTDSDDPVSYKFPPTKMILHGSEDLTVDLPNNFWLDIVLLFNGGLKACGEDFASYLVSIDGNPCTIKQLSSK